tara:strand:+ start:289 stop:861 length:573 start_codon:yes stop_codon:yes gene_type:complete
MNCALTTGRKVLCKSNVGGLKASYFASWNNLDHTQAVLVNGELTQFPEQIFYQWENVSSTFTQNITNNEEGLSYNQTLTMRVYTSKNEGKDFFIVNPLRLVDIRVIVQNNEGYIVMAGFKNGLRLTNYTRSTGAAHGDFTGYEFTFIGKEEIPAPTMASVEVPDIELVNNFFFEDKNNFIFQDGVNFIFQ